MEKIEINVNSPEELEKKLPKELKPKNNFSNKILAKIDNAMFKMSEIFILYFVRKSKFQKNKYKIMLILRCFNIALFLFAVFFLTPIGYILLLKKENEFNTISLIICSVMLLPFLFIIFFEVLEYVKTKIKAVEYEPLFLMQKHSQVYFSVKQKVKFQFIIDKKWRLKIVKFRLFIIAIFFPFFFLLLVINGIGLEDSFALPIFLFHFISLLDDYIACIFDFDKPDGKKKKAKKELTELMRKLIENLTRAMQPSPSPL